LRRLDDRARDRVLGVALDRSGQGQQPVAILIFGSSHFDHAWPAFGKGSGLVESDPAHIAQPLQGITLAKQNARARGTAHADHDRHRRGQAHRAGAGDDQHRDRIDQRQPERRLRPQPQPGQQRDPRDCHHHRHEHPGDPIDQRLDRQAIRLGLLDHLDDAGQHGIRTGGPGLHPERAGPVERTADHLVALLLPDRVGLARDHRFVDPGSAIDDHAVDRHLGTGLDLNDIADLDRVQRHFNRLAVTLDPGSLRCQFDQSTDGAGAASARDRLEPAPEQDQGHDHGRGFKVDIGRPFGQHCGNRGGNHRVAPGRGSAQHDQRVHVRPATQQRRQPVPEEHQTRTEQHQAGQQQLSPKQRLPSQAGIQPGGKAGNQVPAHLGDEHRQRQHRRPQETALHRCTFGGLACAAGIRLVVDEFSLVADPAHGIDRRTGVGTLENLQRSPARGQIDSRLEDLRQFRQRALDLADAGGAMHAVDVQAKHLGRRRKASLGQGRDGIPQRRSGFGTQARLARCRIDRVQLDPGQRGNRLLDASRAAGTMHVGNAQRQQCGGF